jgi:hypothetical protein
LKALSHLRERHGVSLSLRLARDFVLTFNCQVAAYRRALRCPGRRAASSARWLGARIGAGAQRLGTFNKWMVSGAGGCCRIVSRNSHGWFHTAFKAQFCCNCCHKLMISSGIADEAQRNPSPREEVFI